MLDLLIVGVTLVGVVFLWCWVILWADEEFYRRDWMVKCPPTPLPKLPPFIVGLLGEDPEFKLLFCWDMDSNCLAGSTSRLLVTYSFAGIIPVDSKALVLWLCLCVMFMGLRCGGCLTWFSPFNVTIKYIDITKHLLWYFSSSIIVVLFILISYFCRPTPLACKAGVDIPDEIR